MRQLVARAHQLWQIGADCWSLLSLVANLSLTAWCCRGASTDRKRDLLLGCAVGAAAVLLTVTAAVILLLSDSGLYYECCACVAPPPPFPTGLLIAQAGALILVLLASTYLYRQRKPPPIRAGPAIGAHTCTRFSTR